MCSRRVAAELTFGGRKAIHNKVKQTHVNVNLQLFLLQRLIWRKKAQIRLKIQQQEHPSSRATESTINCPVSRYLLLKD